MNREISDFSAIQDQLPASLRKFHASVKSGMPTSVKTEPPKPKRKRKSFKAPASSKYMSKMGKVFEGLADPMALMQQASSVNTGMDRQQELLRMARRPIDMLE